MTIKIKLAGLLCLSAAFILLACILPPELQPQSFHHFADTRTWLHIPNAGNVLSNLSFLLIAVYGLSSVKSFGNKHCQQAYITAFAGLLLTAFGSAYYHWSPDNNSLIWDRLPMTLTFTPLLAAIIAERIQPTSNLILIVCVCLGMASVIYLNYSGNIIPYFIAQYGCIALLLITTLLFPAKRDRWLYFACIAYGIAIVCDRSDTAVFQITQQTVSGHTIKHIIAATSFYFIIFRIRNPGRSKLN